MNTRCDVNDDVLRAAFIDRGLAEGLGSLSPERKPRWGSFTAAQMIEHLLWAFEVSTGRVVVTCSVSEEWLHKARGFLHDNRPMPRGFENPWLREGPPPLRFATIPEAVEALALEARRFLDLSSSDPASRHIHPVFGPASPEEWSRMHFKHGVHHLLQFDLIEVEEAPPAER